MTAGFALPVVILLAGFVVVPAAIGRRHWAVAVGFCTGGAGVSLQVPAVYTRVDPLLGGINLSNLAYHLLTLVGIAAFVLLVWTANPLRDRAIAMRAVTASTVVVCMADVGLFWAGIATAGWGRIDPHLGARVATPLFVAYAGLLWIELAGLAVATIVTEREQTRGRAWSVARAGMTLVIAGSAVALAWSGNAVVFAVAAVAHRQEPPADRLGPVLALVAGVAVFVGLALTNLVHAIRWVQAIGLDLSTRALWRRAVLAAPEVALPVRNRLSIGSRATLYRRWVEIEDATRLGRLALTPREQEHVASMQHLFAPAAPSRPVSFRAR